ncbi:MAG TPA: hypothetical protein EYP65_06230 [Armatimonadetes bacterium]|nr:hypothetical protein [Armatimonadota bacterium]
MPRGKRRVKAPVPVIVQWLFLGGLALVVAALLTYHVTRETKWWFWTILGVGGAAFVASLIINRKAVVDFLKARATRYSAAIGANFLIVLGIVAAVNYISSLRGYRIDFTQNKRYTLSPQTVKIIKSIKHPVTVTAFYRPDSWNYEDVRILLDQYKELGRGKIKVRFVDPDKNPGLARAYGITMSGTTVFECQGRREETTGSEEQDFTSALLKVISTERKKVYFLEGHGERDPESYDDLGYSYAKEALEKERYTVEKLNLLTQKTIPEACDVLVIAGPEKPLMKEEVEEVRKYLERGGRVMVMIEPPPAPGLDDLLEGYGIKVHEDMVLDPGAFLARGFFAEISTPVVAGDRIKWHEITRPLTRARGVALFFPTCRSLEKEESPPSGVTVDSLLETTDQAWGETNPREPRLDEGVDHKGPLTLALAVEKELESEGKKKGKEKTKKRARIVVVGDADFACNQFFRGTYNADFFMNAINWLAEEEELVSIRPKEPERRELTMDIKARRLMVLVTLFILPGLCVALGVVVWWRRR